MYGYGWDVCCLYFNRNYNVIAHSMSHFIWHVFLHFMSHATVWLFHTNTKHKQKKTYPCGQRGSHHTPSRRYGFFFLSFFIFTVWISGGPASYSVVRAFLYELIIAWVLFLLSFIILVVDQRDLWCANCGTMRAMQCAIVDVHFDLPCSCCKFNYHMMCLLFQMMYVYILYIIHTVLKADWLWDYPMWLWCAAIYAAHIAAIYLNMLLL